MIRLLFNRELEHTFEHTFTRNLSTRSRDFIIHVFPAVSELNILTSEDINSLVLERITDDFQDVPVYARPTHIDMDPSGRISIRFRFRVSDNFFRNQQTPVNPVPREREREPEPIVETSEESESYMSEDVHEAESGRPTERSSPRSYAEYRVRYYMQLYGQRV